MKLTLLGFFSLLFCSCTYQYFTLSANQLPRDGNDDFVIENDTLKLTYRFSGDHGPLKITIYNKTNELLEVDWRKSALIMNNKAYGYYSPNLLFNGSVKQDTLKQDYNPTFFARVKADIYANEPSQFIPPSSSISKTPLSLPVHSLDLPEEELKKIKYSGLNDYSLKYKKIEYTSEKSPISFRLFLSFSFGSNNRKEFFVDHQFYVSEIWESGIGPEYFPQEIVEKGNVFHVMQ